MSAIDNWDREVRRLLTALFQAGHTTHSSVTLEHRHEAATKGQPARWVWVASCYNARETGDTADVAMLALRRVLEAELAKKITDARLALVNLERAQSMTLRVVPTTEEQSS